MDFGLTPLNVFSYGEEHTLQIRKIEALWVYFFALKKSMLSFAVQRN
jgi:hypothetical protein